MLLEAGLVTLKEVDGAAAGCLMVGYNDGIEEPELLFADGDLIDGERVDDRGSGCHICFCAAFLREPASATG